MTALLVLQLVGAQLAGAPVTPIVPAAVFHACPSEGTAKVARVVPFNRLKNRAVAPATIDTAVTLEQFFELDDDTDRFSVETAVTIHGLVTDVKVGGIETVNCGATDPRWRDTHIAIVADQVQRTLPMIVEVTPRWREAMRAIGVDWSTATLKQTLLGHDVEFTGWLFFDGEHTQNAQHTNPTGTNLWRSTVWELHPVTALRIVDPEDP